MKKVFERQIITSDGELLSSETIKIGSNEELFFFARTTQGLEWIKVFKELQDLQLLMVLVEYQDPKSGVAILTKLQIEEIASFFNKNEKTIRNSISRLIKVGCVYKIANCNYLVNPEMFYKGGTKHLAGKIKDWNTLQKRKVDYTKELEEKITNFEKNN